MIKEKIIIDADPGVDDAVAIILLMHNQNVDIKLITTVAGNLGIKTTTKNAKFLLEKFNKNIPLAIGADKPLSGEGHFAIDIHGESGLGGITDIEIKNNNILPDAVEEIYKVIKENPHEITILELAPHTNLAHLFIRHPDAKELIKQIIFEGGSPYGKQNVKPHISFNLSFDPKSVDIVMKTDIKKILVPSEVGRYLAPFSESEVEQIKQTNDTGKFLSKMFEGYKSKYILNSTETNDLSAAMYLLYPQIFSSYNCNVVVDVTSQPGKTTITEDKNGKIIFVDNVDKNKFFNLFIENLKAIK